MKKPEKKTIFNLLFLVIVFALTLWSVFSGVDFRQLADFLSNANPLYTIPSVLCVIAFILGESVIIHYLLRTLGTKVAFSHCCLYSFIGFFYSCITPSASGGQPMQVVAMRKDKIPVAVSAVVLAIITITYKLVLVVIGVSILVFRPSSIMKYLDGVEWIMYLGLALNVVCIAGLLLLVFSSGVVRSIAIWALNLVDRIRPLHNRHHWEEKLDNLISQYNGTADFYRNNQGIILKVFGITFVQRCFLFFVTWLTYLAFSLSGESMFVVVSLQGMISVAVDMLPLPGGMGISENLFLTIFQPIFGESLVLPGMLISRGISFYTQLIISAIMTVIASFILKRKEDSSMLHFIGFYDYTVILTYLSLISALCGITQATSGHFNAAVICLGICGVCDSFDGRIARTKKNRTEDEKAFGVQIDSLCDLVCFGVFPAVFCYCLGLKGIIGLVIISFFCICAVIRLAYYNVLDEKKKNGTYTDSAAFHGLPVTMSSILVALTYCLTFIVPENIFIVILHIVPVLIGFLNILDFRIEKKPSLKGLIALIVIVSSFVIGMILINVLGA